MNQQERLRYSRHFLLPEIGPQGQEKLKRSKVLVIGAGGLGSPAALYLAAAGVGTLTLVDFDIIDESNLQRQVLYSSSEIGSLKAEKAADRLRNLNPFIQVNGIAEKLTKENALELFAVHDVIADGADNFATRYLANDAAVRMGKPLVSASILGFEGQLAVFHHQGGPCYRCLYPEPPPAGLVPSCAENGVLGVLPGVLGVLQATETLKIILGLGETLHRHLLYFDALRMDFQKLETQRNPDCPACGTRPRGGELGEIPEALCEAPVVEIECRELKAMRDRKDDFQLVDVREDREVRISRIEGALHLPIGDIESRAGELDSERPVVVYCRSGARSARAATLLSAKGFRVRSLRGGILAWIDQIDPALTRPS